MKVLVIQANIQTKFLDAVCKTAVISLVSVTLTKKKSQDLQLELLHHYIKFHPNQNTVIFGLLSAPVYKPHPLIFLKNLNFIHI